MSYSNFVPGALSMARKSFYAYDEFINFVNSPFFLSTGSGSIASLAPNDVSTIGLGAMNTGSGATNRQGVWSSNTDVLYFNTSTTWTFESRIKMPTLSDATDTYTILTGFSDVATGDAVDGAYFSYSHGLNAGKFELITANNSVRTRTDSGITVVADTWYSLKVIVQSVGGTLTARFYINGVLVGGDITTNIPNTSARLTGYGTHIIKSVGTNNRYVALDYMEIAGYFENSR